MSTDKNLWMGDVQPWMDEAFILRAFNYYNFFPNSIKLIHDRNTKELKNYCFINFDTIEEANNCLIKLNGKNIPNSKTNFKLNWANYFSSFNKSIYVGNLSPDVDDISLYKLFKDRYPSVLHASVITDKGASKGFGFILFKGEKDYEKCLKEMNGISFHGNVIKVNEQKKKDENKNKTIFSYNNHDDFNDYDNSDNYDNIIYNNEQNNNNINNNINYLGQNSNNNNNFLYNYLNNNCVNNIYKKNIDSQLISNRKNINNINIYHNSSKNSYITHFQQNNININNPNIINNIINIKSINKIQNINYINDINKIYNSNKIMQKNNNRISINIQDNNYTYKNNLNNRNNNNIIELNNNQNINRNNQNEINEINNRNNNNYENNETNKKSNQDNNLNKINLILNKSAKKVKKDKYNLEILNNYSDTILIKKIAKNLDTTYNYYMEKFPFEINRNIISNMFIYYCQKENQLKFFCDIY